jgi:hypothetical protein
VPGLPRDRARGGEEVPRVRQRRLVATASRRPHGLALALALALALPAAGARGAERAGSAAEVTVDGPGNVEATVLVRREGFAAQPADTAHGEKAEAARRKQGKRALARWNRSSQFVGLRELPDSGLVRAAEWRYRVLAPIAGVGTVRVPLAMWPGGEMAAACGAPAAGRDRTTGLELSATTRLSLPVRATLDSVPEPFRVENAFGEAACEVRRLEHGLEWTWTLRVREGLACGPGEDEGLRRLADEAGRALAAVVEVRLNGSEVHSRIPVGSPPAGHTHGGGGGHH